MYYMYGGISSKLQKQYYVVCRYIPTQEWDMDVIVDFNDHGTGQLKYCTPKAFEKGTYKNRKKWVSFEVQIEFFKPARHLTLIWKVSPVTQQALERYT